VVANSGTNTIGIFLNDGNGNFTPQITFTTGDASRSSSVVVGDFNNDTHLDVAVANYDTHNIGIFLGYGDGTFANYMTFSTDASRPVSLATGDLNNDRRLDIVVANNGTDSIGIFFGYGNGSFANPITYSTGYDSRPCSVVVADFNNDQYLDIAVANYGTDNVGIFLRSRNGSFDTQITYSTSLHSKPSSIAVNDFNRDEHLDIVVANSGTNTVRIFFGDGNGNFQTQSTYSISPGSNPHSIRIGDFNQDNRLDIAVSNFDTNNISILIGYGNGSFATPTILSTGSDDLGPFGITIDDFDNNNQSDIAVVNFFTNKVLALIGYYMMQSQSPATYSAGNSSFLRQLASGDLNNDTNIDLVVANSATNSIDIFFGYGNGSFQEQVTHSTGDPSHPIAVAISDIDRDDRQDILVGNAYSESLRIFYGLGNGSFGAPVTYFTGKSSSVAWVAVDDCNNDNYLDIFFADRYTDSIGVLLGYGNRTFGSPNKFFCGIGSRPLSVATGDFNKDGRLDIAAACYGTANLVIFLGFDNGNFTLFTIYSAGDTFLPFMLAVADLNRDSQLDIIVTNAGTNYFDIFFGFGNGSFAAPLIFFTGDNSQPVWVTVADLNNDCSLDLTVANSNNNNVGVFLGNSSEYFSHQTTYSTGYGSIPYGIAVGDFNKDNRPDIAVMNSGSSNIAILLGHPTENSTTQTVETAYKNSKSSSLAINPFDHDMQLNCTIGNWTANDLPILLGDYYPNFRHQTTYSTGSSSAPFSLAVGDLNGDKQMDIIVANSGSANLGILFGYDNGSFRNELIVSLYSSANPQNVIVDDFNRDHLLDVAVTDPRNDCIIVLLGNGNGTFSTTLIYPTGFGSSPKALASGNLDKDDYLDLIVADSGTDTIGIFFGFDYTSFSEQNSYETGNGSNPRSLAIGDFNNDGQLDIVAALYGTNSVGIFLGYGNGTFTSMMKFADVPASHPWWLAVGDFNNDNKLDITVVNWAINSISVILGYGNGSFTNPILYSTGSNTHPETVAVADFNNDHCLDITATNYGGDSICVFLGYGNGTFQNCITLLTGKSSGPNAIVAADINNDSRLDILVANYGSNNVGVFLGYGNGSFAEQMTFSTGTNSAPRSIVIGDFNNDGRSDVAVANYATNNVGVLNGYGNGTFGNLQTYSTGVGSNPTIVQVGDFNNDSLLDIIVGGANLNHVGVLFGYGDGTFASLSTISSGQGSYTYAIAIGDFNQDNRLDFAFADFGNNNIGIFLASGSEPFGGQTTYFVGEGSYPSSIAFGHFNDDNQLDIAFANYGTDNLGILFGDGNRLFSNNITYSTGAGSDPMSSAIGDFNNDSRTDIVVANSGSNDIVVFIGYSNGSFSSSISYSMSEGSQPESVAVGDFNRDNRLDIAVANFGTNNICLLFGRGNGTFTNQSWYPLTYDSRPKCVIVKDLNNDGRDDIAAVTYGIDNVNMFLIMFKTGGRRGGGGGS